MQCPTCGYIFKHQEEDQPCPRCANLRADAPQKAPVPATFADQDEKRAPGRLEEYQNAAKKSMHPCLIALLVFVGLIILAVLLAFGSCLYFINQH